MNNKFDRIEAHLQLIFEKSLPEFFTGSHQQSTLIDKLVRVIKASQRTDEQQRVIVPDCLILNVSPDDLIEWKLRQDILNEITVVLQQICANDHLFFLRSPKIEVHSDPQINPGSFEISAFFSESEKKLTNTTAIEPADQQANSSIPENALLIIEGRTDFYLYRPIINIGRHSTNDLILNDPHISRHHAQLRAINNHFVIFDVGSTGGVFINGRQIAQATLHAGDVIKIGSTVLIFNQEPTNVFSTTVISLDDDDDDET